MNDIEQLQNRIKDLEKQNVFLQNKLRLYELPSPARAYYVGQKMLNQQVDYLDKFELEKEIGANPKEDKIYDRAISLFEKLTTNATNINSLKSVLNLSGNEKEDTKNEYQPYTPEMAADQIGESAGQNKL